MISPDLEEQHHRKLIFGRDFGSIFWEYLTEEFSSIRGVIRRSAFVVVIPILFFMANGAAMHARCYMLFVGRCY